MQFKKLFVSLLVLASIVSAGKFDGKTWLNGNWTASIENVREANQEYKVSLTKLNDNTLRGIVFTENNGTRDIIDNIALVFTPAETKNEKNTDFTVFNGKIVDELPINKLAEIALKKDATTNMVSAQTTTAFGKTRLIAVSGTTAFLMLDNEHGSQTITLTKTSLPAQPSAAKRMAPSIVMMLLMIANKGYQAYKVTKNKKAEPSATGAQQPREDDARAKIRQSAQEAAKASLADTVKN